MQLSPATIACGVLLIASVYGAEESEPLSPLIVDVPQHVVLHAEDSGVQTASDHSKSVVFTTTVTPTIGVPWVRLHFDQSKTLLSGDAQLMIRSTKDGFFQRLNAESIAQWGYSSAYFNGDTVTVDLIASAKDGQVRVAISGATVGEHVSEAMLLHRPYFCSGFDARTWHTKPKSARYLIEGGGGCTGWLIDDDEHCFLTAGHCGTSAAGTMQFQVPISEHSGSIQHPHPDDQYALDPESVQYLFTGVGADWKYVGAFPNSNTGKTAAEAQGDWYRLEREGYTPRSNELIEHFGYGTAVFPDRSFSQVQKGLRARIESVSGATMNLLNDVSGGDSGSPIALMTARGSPSHDDGRWRGRAVGIVTHGGCPTGTNKGTLLHGRSDLQDALRNPKGVCAGKRRAKHISKHDVQLERDH